MVQSPPPHTRIKRNHLIFGNESSSPLHQNHSYHLLACLLLLHGGGSGLSWQLLLGEIRNKNFVNVRRRVLVASTTCRQCYLPFPSPKIIHLKYYETRGRIPTQTSKKIKSTHIPTGWLVIPCPSGGTRREVGKPRKVLPRG